MQKKRKNIAEENIEKVVLNSYYDNFTEIFLSIKNPA